MQPDPCPSCHCPRHFEKLPGKLERVTDLTNFYPLKSFSLVYSSCQVGQKFEDPKDPFAIPGLRYGAVLQLRIDYFLSQYRDPVQQIKSDAFIPMCLHSVQIRESTKKWGRLLQRKCAKLLFVVSRTLVAYATGKNNLLFFCKCLGILVPVKVFFKWYFIWIFKTFIYGT